jgi:hypothetical protein
MGEALSVEETEKTTVENTKENTRDCLYPVWQQMACKEASE